MMLTWWTLSGEDIQLTCRIANEFQFSHFEYVWKATSEKKKLVKDWWIISKGDKDFMTTIEEESKRNPATVWDQWRAFWLCQRRMERHKHIIKNKNFKNPERQLQKCWEYYSEKKANWTISNQLYWWNRRKKNEPKFKQINDSVEKLYCEASTVNNPNVDDEVEKFLLQKKIKYRLWSTWPEYFDCWWIVTFALKEVAWYTWQRLSSHIQADFVPFHHAKRGDILISTIEGERHVARISEWYDKWIVTVLDYVDNHTDAWYRYYTNKKWLKIIRIK